MAQKLYGEEELKFVQTAPKEDLEDYCRMHVLSEAAELMLLERGERDILWFYSGNYIFFDSVLLKFLDLRDRELIKHYIDTAHEPFPPAAELKLIARNNKELIKVYLKHFGCLCDETISELMDSGNEKFLDFYLRRFDDLSPENENKLMDLGNEKLIQSYIEWHTLLDCEAQVKLLKLGDKKLLKEYLQANTLCAEAERELIKLGDEELVQEYASCHDFLEEVNEEPVQTGVLPQEEFE